MTTVVIRNGMLVGVGDTCALGWIKIVDGKIAGIGRGAAPEGGRQIDAGGRFVFPGFIDVHVHGALGVAVMDGKAESLRTMARCFARYGVTAFLPTTWTGSRADTQAALENVARCTGPQPDGATIIGAHLEGPYLNPERCGAQQVGHIRRAGREEATAFLEIGVIRLAALAPEFSENQWFLEECVRRGVAVSAAHTSATFAQMEDMVRRGMRQVTHMYNAMSPLHHREPGVVGAALLLPELRCELIADNIHVHPAAMAVLYRAKGRGGIILISDAVEAAGMPEGSCTVDGREVVVADGAVRLPDGTLAGSILTMDRALRNLARATGERIENLWESASLNAARAIGIENRKGRLAEGLDGDVAILDRDGQVWQTIAEGRVVYVRE